MNSNRRQFIRKAGAGLAGLGIFPAFGRMGQYWGPDTRPDRGPGDWPERGLSDRSDLTDNGLRFSDDFARATPESQGITSQSIRQFITAANASAISWHSFMLLRHGQVVAEGWWKPYESQYVHSLYSLSKSFTSTAIGLLVKEGKLDIHASVISFFPEDIPANVSENLKKMTVRSLLTMNTGHAEDTMPKMRASQASWVRTYLAQPVESAPGSHFLYNTGNTYMLGAILHTVTGETLEAYLTPRLFRPLGITGYDWETSPQGLNTAGYGLRVRTEDIAKLGQLYLQKGKWKDETILSPAWVEEATSAQTTSQVNNGDWSEGYGYQFWRCTHGFYRGDGAFGQFCIVMPQHDAVLVVTGQSPDMQKSMTIIWENLLPGIQTGVLPENSGEQLQLKKDLAELGLPVVKGAVASSLAGKYNDKKWTFVPNDLHVQTMQFAFSNKGCRLTVSAGAAPSVLEFGWEKWTTNAQREPYIFNPGEMVPMPSKRAGTATWINDHTLQLNVRFVEAIFGDAITCVFEGGQVTVGFLNSVAETALKKTPDPRKPLSGSMG